MMPLCAEDNHSNNKIQTQSQCLARLNQLPTLKCGEGKDMFMSRHKFTSVSTVLHEMSSFQSEITKKHKESRNNNNNKTHTRNKSVK